MKKLIKIMLICNCLLLLTGCKNFFVPEDQPFAVASQQNDPATVKTELKMIGEGKLIDAAPEQKRLLIVDQMKNNINTLQLNNGQWNRVNVYNSDNNITNAALDSQSAGIYLTEHYAAENKQSIVWSTLDRANTKAISKADEKVLSSPFVIGEYGVLYQNDKNDFIIVNEKDDRTIFEMDYPYTIQKSLYDTKRNAITFMAKNPDTDKQNLYCLYIDTIKPAVKPQIIARDIVDFDLGSDGKNLVVMKDQIATIDPISMTKTIIAEGKYSKAVFSPDQKKIIAARQTEAKESELQTLWMIDIEDHHPIQITGPTALNSKLVFIDDQLIFSSDVNNTLFSDDITESMIFSLQIQNNKN